MQVKNGYILFSSIVFAFSFSALILHSALSGGYIRQHRSIAPSRFDGSFPPISRLEKCRNTACISALFKSYLDKKSFAESDCRIAQCCHNSFRTRGCFISSYLVIRLSADCYKEHSLESGDFPNLQKAELCIDSDSAFPRWEEFHW